MNKKDQKELKKSWALTVVGVLLGFLVSVSGQAMYDMYINGFTAKKISLFIGFSVFSIIFANLFYFMIETINEPEDKSFFKFINRYIRYII
jgi:hypothetical protein